MARYCQKTVEFVLQELVQLKREVSVTAIKNIQKKIVSYNYARIHI